MFKFTRVIELIFISALLCSFNVHAGIYKCTDAEGAIIYSQTPCPNSQETVKVLEATSSQYPATVDCSYANKFARVTARSMKNGAGSNDIFNQYGGLDSLSKGTINLINYVYVYRLNEDISVDRIAGLTQAKCQAHSLGNVACEELPSSFTDGLGGCGSEDEESVPEQSFVDRQPTELQIEQENRIAEEASLARKREAKARSDENSRQCKERYQTQIDQLDQQMRSGYTSEQGNSFRERRRNLGRQLKQC